MKKTLFFSNIKGDICSNEDNVSFNEHMENYLVKNIDNSYSKVATEQILLNGAGHINIESGFDTFEEIVNHL